MPYPHLSPCTLSGMPMAIAPLEGPTQKRRLEPQGFTSTLQQNVCA